MSRREFSKQTKRDAFMRANGACEMCGARLTVGKYAYDHVIADGLGGEPTLDNCCVACVVCHSEKSARNDVPRIAKVRRIQDREHGIRKASGFRKAAPQHSATRPLARRTDT